MPVLITGKTDHFNIYCHKFSNKYKIAAANL